MRGDRFLGYTLIGMVVLLASAILPLVLLGYQSWAVTIVIGFFISFVYIVFAYITIHQAFGKSTKKFYRVLFGGMAFRFTFFLLCLFLIYKFTQLPIMGFILAFMVFYIIFQVLEARLVLREIKKQKSI